MVRSWKAIGFYLVMGILGGLSCVREIENVEAEYFFGNHQGDSVVLGRIGVVEADVEKSWESPQINPFTETFFRIFIRERHAKLKVSHYLIGDGYFCLSLPPGKYTVWRWVYKFPGGQANSVEPLPFYFDAVPGKIIYIGTLYVHLPSISSRPQRARPRYEIIDDYIMAMEFSKNQYPHFPPSMERHLMYFSR